MTEKRVCENCKFEAVDIFEEPCRSCNVNTNDKWEEQE